MLWTGHADTTAVFRALSRPGRRLQVGAYSTRDVGVAPDTARGPRDNHTSQTSEGSSTTETHTAHTLSRKKRQQDPPTSSLIDAEALRTRLKAWGVLATSSLHQRADQFSRRAMTAFSQLGPHLNRVTGYEEIETLKRQVVAQEARIKAARRTAREAKTTYDDAVHQRSVSQRRVNDLLQRKSSWTDTDVSDFTSLVRSDHAFEQEESRAKVRVAAMEDAVEREFSELMRVILARYHEEQVWSDKIRSASTYGSLAVLGINLFVFIMAIVVVEPWKRRKLAQTFQKKVEEMGAETKALMHAGAVRLEEQLTGHEKLLTELVTQVPAEARQGSFDAATAPEETSTDETPMVLPPTSSWWPQEFYPNLGIVHGRELMLIVGSAAAGGVITLLTRSLFVR